MCASAGSTATTSEEDAALVGVFDEEAPYSNEGLSCDTSTSNARGLRISGGRPIGPWLFSNANREEFVLANVTLAGDVLPIDASAARSILRKLNVPGCTAIPNSTPYYGAYRKDADSVVGMAIQSRTGTRIALLKAPKNKATVIWEDGSSCSLPESSQKQSRPQWQKATCPSLRLAKDHVGFSMDAAAKYPPFVVGLILDSDTLHDAALKAELERLVTTFDRTPPRVNEPKLGLIGRAKVEALGFSRGENRIIGASSPYTPGAGKFISQTIHFWQYFPNPPPDFPNALRHDLDLPFGERVLLAIPTPSKAGRQYLITRPFPGERFDGSKVAAEDRLRLHRVGFEGLDSLLTSPRLPKSLRIEVTK